MILKFLFSFVIVTSLFMVNSSFAANEFTFAPRDGGLSHCAVLPIGIHPNCGAFEDNEDERPHIEAPADIVIEATSLQTPKEDLDLGSIIPDDNYANCVDCELPEVNNDAPNIFPLGDTLVTWIATFPTSDEEGTFTANAEQIVTLVDTTEPKITLQTNIILEAPTDTTANTGKPIVTDAVDPNPEISFSDVESLDSLGLGTITRTWTAIDSSGNSISADQTITIQDTTAPVQSNLPPNTTIEATGPEGIVFTYTNPTATDDVDQNPTVTCNPPSGSTLDLGINKISCTATDKSGNESSVAFQITIKLPEPEKTPPNNTISVNPIESKIPSIGKTSEILFSGNIENYGRGMPIKIEIFDSSSSRSTFEVFGTDKGSYQFLYQLTHQNPPGKYTADVFYQNQKINSLSFDLVDEIAFKAPEVPSWIKNNAGWWAKDAINDQEFITGIQFLITEGIIVIPETSKTIQESGEQEIPSWIKNNAGWWSQSLISDNDFVKGIQYLIENGIIVV